VRLALDNDFNISQLMQMQSEKLNNQSIKYNITFLK